MKLKVVAIGNSRGIRIPKPLLDQAGIESEVEIEVEGNTLILRSTQKHPRATWSAAFKTMSENKDDELLDSSEASTEFERDEWEWK